MSTESISIAASRSGRPARSRRQKVWALIWVAIAIAAAYFLVPELAGLQESSAAARARASIDSAARDIAAVFRQPGRAAALFASSAGLPLSFGLALWTSAIASGVTYP
jgi:hypothetical protein